MRYWHPDARYEALLEIPEFEVVPFGPDDIPKELNNHAVTHPAHMSDFRRMQVLLEHGGIYFDTDHILLRPLDELLRFREVFGRQGKNGRGYQVSVGAPNVGQQRTFRSLVAFESRSVILMRATFYEWKQVAVGFMMAAQGSEVIRKMIDLMQQKFDGGWVSHSVNMVDAFFDQRKYAADAPPPCDECLVLPYGALFPFSWNRKDLCCDYYYHEGKPATSLFGGTGFRWDAQYVRVAFLRTKRGRCICVCFAHLWTNTQSIVAYKFTCVAYFVVTGTLLDILSICSTVNRSE